MPSAARFSDTLAVLVGEVQRVRNKLSEETGWPTAVGIATEDDDAQRPVSTSRANVRDNARKSQLKPQCQTASHDPRQRSTTSGSCSAVC